MTCIGSSNIQKRAEMVEYLLNECKEYMDRTGVLVYPCPCLMCRGCSMLTFQKIEEHLLRKGPWQTKRSYKKVK
jgi:hypothetical protein